MAREWEPVSETELNGLDTARLAGMSREGKAMNAKLMKKWKKTTAKKTWKKTLI
jgi:hypothetical protein